MPSPPAVVLRTDRLLLLQLGAADAERAVAYFERNRARFAPWYPRLGQDFYDVDTWRTRIERYRADETADLSLRLALVERSDPDGELLGQINFTDVFRGPFQACNLGFGLDGGVAGRGLMTEALAAAIPFVFVRLRLHRIQANYQPTNERSGRLLRRLGFTVEGYARDYLYIDGAWRDHVLTSLTNPSPAPPAAVIP